MERTGPAWLTPILLLALGPLWACRGPAAAFGRTLDGHRAPVGATLLEPSSRALGEARPDVVRVLLDAPPQALDRVVLSGLDRAPVEARQLEPANEGGTVAWFPRAGLDVEPWLLRVEPRGREAYELPLAQLESASLGPCHEHFGYRAETWTLSDGRRRQFLVQGRGASTRWLPPIAAETIRPSLERLCAALPRTVRWASTCTRVGATVARFFEAGVVYEGPAEGQNRHPHARGGRFWSRARSIDEGRTGRAGEDPLDTLVWFLVEAKNAEASRAYAQIWGDVLAGRLSEGEYMQREARQKAESLRFAVQTLRSNADCLDLDAWVHPYGQVFREYARWVDGSRGSDEALARTILEQRATYRDNPEESGLTYGERLRLLWWSNSPRALGRRRS